MVSFSSGKRVLLVGGEGIVLFGPSARGIERETAISWEIPNFDQQMVTALMKQNQGNAVMVLFDGADQTYRKEENVPKLSMFDRPRFIKRKLDLAFPNYPVRASIQIKPPKGAEKEGLSYLFVAIPETDRLDRIGENILEAGAPVAGFGLLPAEAEGLVTTLSTKRFGKKGKKSRWSVLIGQHESGGLRQVVVKDGNLALTRMTPTTESGTQGPGWVEEVMREFKATLTYIARFGYSAEEGLDVIVLCGDIEKQFFDQRAMPATNFECLKVTEALAAIGVKGVSIGTNNFGDILHAAWVGKKRSLAVPIKVPSIQKIMVPRLAARAVMALLILTFIGMGVLTFNEYQEYSRIEADVEQKESLKSKLQKEYGVESKIFDELPIKPALVSGALAVKKAVDQSSINISPLLNVLRKTLDGDIKISELIFENSTASAPKSAIGGAIRGVLGEAAGSSVKISFKFTITGINSLEQKVTRAEQLAENLKRAFPGYEVKIRKQFGNISRTGGLRGEAGKTQAASGQEDTAEFEMMGEPL